MNEQRENTLRKEIDELFELGRDGKMDFASCTMKVARKVLEQDGCDVMLHGIVAGLMANNATMPLGIVAHLLMLRVLRLEDDVRKLRSEVAKERVESTRENIENVEYRGEGKRE